MVMLKFNWKICVYHHQGGTTKQLGSGHGPKLSQVSPVLGKIDRFHNCAHW